MRDNHIINVGVARVNVVVEDGFGVVCVAAKWVHHVVVVIEGVCNDRVALVGTFGGMLSLRTCRAVMVNLIGLVEVAGRKRMLVYGTRGT